MKNDLFTIKFDTNPSPWFSSIIEINFSRLKIQPIVDDLVKECSDKTYSSSYQYDKHLEKIIDLHWDKSLGSIRPFLQAIKTLLCEQYPASNERNWHNGYVAALRTIESKMAWLTPGFAEAKRYNELYGSWLNNRNVVLNIINKIELETRINLKEDEQSKGLVSIPIGSNLNCFEIKKGYHAYYEINTYSLFCRFEEKEVIVSCSKYVGASQPKIDCVKGNLYSKKQFMWSEVFEQDFNLLLESVE